MSRADSYAATRPVQPEFNAAQRCRVVFDFIENGDPVHEAEEGWGRIDGPWLHFHGDESALWQSWPTDRVVCVDWTSEPTRAQHG